ncbi:GvpL/GvpF family gas vesicle protein [Streptomyces sp. NPDC089424]|uniref:GvpL/GvpF family gas vesicle protein n=1 Tax=Streptomyces sp. NPDC089424 TaxID=3365917 RepID=UPI00382EB204
MDDRLSYVYGVLRPDAASPEDAVPPGVRGVEDAPVALVRHGGMAAAVSHVAKSDFSEAALKAHLEDLDWLEGVARAHDEVVAALGARTTVLPLRLATVYLDDSRVRDMLEERERTLTELLDRLAGQVEWGVKVYADTSPAAARPQAPSGAPEPPDSGRAYLRQRRQQRHAREDAWSSAAEAVRRVEAQAGSLAVAHARHRPQQGRLAGGTGENVANDAYLVPRDRAEEFRERVQGAAEGLDGVRVEVTGPWVPYSFAQVPHDPAPEEAGQR